MGESELPFHFYNYTCTNSIFAEQVFDSYEEALDFATQKNKGLCDKIWIYLLSTEDLEDQFAKKIKEFNNTLSKYIKC